MAGQRLFNHASVLVVLVGDFVPAVGHAGELVALVVLHRQRCLRPVRAGQDLFRHVPGPVVGVALAISRRLQEFRQLSRRVVGIAAGHGRAVLPADLAREVPVPVIGVAERYLAFPMRDLFHQISHAVIAV